MLPALEDGFVRELRAFAGNGYRFHDGATLHKESQQEAYQGFLDGVLRARTHGYMEIPTGVGKTPLTIAFIRSFLKANEGKKNPQRVLFVVPTEKLALQTAQAFATFLPEIAKTLEVDGNDGREIDWENGHIGLQYGKVKHADKKPKVLITTYQSLSRDKGNHIYAPNEFGFVIYDEGHSITAPVFGRAVDKFRQAIQLAVTATAEYSDIKKVSDLLPHYYYGLSIAKAINRKDLCDVRPAIIKTGFRIDEALFHEFMEQQNGTPLNERQMQQLLNQEARNQAVIQTYLRGFDPDSRQRYFGQNGMIFATGIKHAEDFKSQFLAELKSGDGQKLNQWLDDEKIEPIATVHGGVKGNWLRRDLLPQSRDERHYRDGKEWYSESEIFDLHEQGKILLLTSVAKLKVGYDCPRDSLLFDLQDRFSKVDATQINGRAFRLDPNDPQKMATVFNLMDENTEALYARYPKLIPIYCAEVIKGAEFRPPARRPHALTRFIAPPPELETSLQAAGYEVITDVNAVRLISARAEKLREEANFQYPEKEDGWLSNNQLPSVYVGKSSTFKLLLENHTNTLRKAFIQQGMTPEAAAAEVDKKHVGWRVSGGKDALCACPLVITELERMKQLQRKDSRYSAREEGWLSNVDIRLSYVGSRAKFKSLLEMHADALRKTFVQRGMSPEAAAIEVDKKHVGWRRVGPRDALCASPAALAELEGTKQLQRKDSGYPDREEGWLSSNSGMMPVYVGNYAKFKRLLEVHAYTLRKAFIQQGMTPEAAAAEVDKKHVGWRRVGSFDAICASPAAIAELERTEQLQRKDSRYPAKEEDWLSNYNMMSIYFGAEIKFKRLLEAHADALRKTFIQKGMTPEAAAAEVDKKYVGWRVISGRDSLCASPAAIAKLEKQGLIKRREISEDFVKASKAQNASKPRTASRPAAKAKPKGTKLAK